MTSEAQRELTPAAMVIAGWLANGVIFAIIVTCYVGTLVISQHILGTEVRFNIIEMIAVACFWSRLWGRMEDSWLTHVVINTVVRYINF